MAGDTPSQRAAEKSRTTTQKQPLQVQTRTRNGSTTGPDRMTAEDILADQTQAVKDVPTARSYLAKAEFIPATVDVTVPQLVNTLILLSSDRSINKQATNVIRAVAILLQSRDVATQTLLIANAVSEQIGTFLEGNKDDGSSLQKSTMEIEKRIMTSIETRLNEGFEGVRKHISDSIIAITPPPPPPHTADTNYRDALLRHDLPNAPSDNRDVDPKLRARQLSKARQILVEFADPQEKEEMRNTSLTALMEGANKFLKDAIYSTAATIVNAAKLTHGGLLLEFNSHDVINQLDQEGIKDAFLAGLGPSAHIRPRQYNVVVYFIPLTFNAGDPDDMREIENLNGLTAHSITATRWIKPPNRRSPHQLVAHAVFTFADPKSANQVIVEGITIRQKKLNAVKSKREPIRCLKCQQWGHLANSCIAMLDTCGTCGENHRTNLCNSPGKYCTPCGVDGHTSWDRDRPTFNAKCGEMDTRTPENQLTYFPTDEPWTHRTHQSPWNPATAQTRPQTHRPTTQAPTRPLVERIAPAGTTTNTSLRKRPRARGLAASNDPSLPSIDGANADTVPAPAPARENTQSRRGGNFQAARPNDHPDGWARASGRGKRKGTGSGPPRMTQTRLDEYRYRPTEASVAGPSRLAGTAVTDPALTQDLIDLLHPSSNFFAPLTPDHSDPPADDAPDNDPPADTQALPPSSDPPLSPAQSPVPSHPRDFPAGLSPIHDWDEPASLVGHASGTADNREYNISLTSNV